VARHSANEFGKTLAIRFSAAEGCAHYLSFPKIISGRIDGAIRPRSEWRQWHRTVALLDARAHLSVMPGDSYGTLGEWSTQFETEPGKEEEGEQLENSEIHQRPAAIAEIFFGVGRMGRLRARP
jgi:hypothetical protein